MRIVALFITLLVLPLVSSGSTAYEALRIAEKERGNVILKRVIEMRGLDGAPVPEVWHVALDDPLARGGVRVIDVKGNQVVGESTPVSGYTSSGETSIIKLTDLNLDSSGVFTVAEKAATENRVAFDRINYSLRLSGPGGKPVWYLALIDAMNAQVGTLEVAADTGTIVVQKWSPGQATGTFDGDSTYVYDEPAPQTPQSPASPSSSSSDFSVEDESKKVWDSMKQFGKRAERHFRRDGAAVQRFFTGESDIDEGLDSPTPSSGR